MEFKFNGIDRLQEKLDAELKSMGLSPEFTKNLAYQDTLDKIKCDFTSTTSYYWGCEGYTCDNCPHQLIDGHKPTDYFDHDSDSCEDAQIMDVIRRIGAFCKKIEKKDE